MTSFVEHNESNTNKYYNANDGRDSDEDRNIKER